MPLNEPKIKAEIERRKQRAKELGLARVIFRLWDQHLRYLKPNFDYEMSCVPRSLKKITRNYMSERGYSVETIELFFGDGSVVFTFNQHNTYMPDGEIHTSGDIIIEIEGRSVFELECRCEDVRYMGVHWSPGEIKGFIEGPWIEDLEKFEQEVRSLSGQRDKRPQSERGIA